MKTCKTCKHWKDNPDNFQCIIHPTDPDSFEEMEMPFKVRQCRSPKLLKHERPVESDQASSLDGSEYMAALVTGPDFGCTSHETE